MITFQSTYTEIQHAKNSLGFFCSEGAAPVAKHTPHSKMSLQSFSQRDLRWIFCKGGRLNVKPQEAEFEAPSSSLLLLLMNYLKWLAAKYMLWEGIFFFQGKSFVRSSCGVMTRYWTGVTKGKRHKDELWIVPKTNDKIPKISKTFKLPAWSGK